MEKQRYRHAPSYVWFNKKSGFLGVRVLDGFDVTDDNVNGRLPTLIEEAGFNAVQVSSNIETLLGALQLIQVKNTQET